MTAPESIVVEGRGLHHGAPARVTVRRSVIGVAGSSPATWNGRPLSAWHAVPAERSTAIVCDGLRLRTVEHLFAALASLGLTRGIDVEIEGPEPPILDGCAAAWTRALSPFAADGAAPPTLRVARHGTIDVATSRYVFGPSESPRVSVELELADPRVARAASWEGDWADFRARIAPARTFCFAHEVEELARAGLASHVTPEMVVVLGPEILAAGRPFSPDEPARHKLLDLVGDLFLYGGPPLGAVHAYRPGHWSSHEAVARALAEGILVRT